MPDREFKETIIRILTGLEKKVKDRIENLNTEIRKNIAEIKGTINKMRNTLDGMKRTTEAAEEQMSNLEDTMT